MIRKGTCKHFNGFYGPGMSEDKKCEAGIEYRSLVGGEDHGWVKQAPCFESHNSEITCDKREWPTDEEIKQSEKEYEDWMNKMRTVLTIVPELKKNHPNGGSGTYKCPLCNGKIHYQISDFNGHIHLKCDTCNVHCME